MAGYHKVNKMSEDFENEYTEEEQKVDELLQKVRPKKLTSIEARKKIEQLRERLALKESESDPLMDTLIF